jgi:hypothetical protein
MVVFGNAGYADEVNSETYTLKTGISVIEQLPSSFFGMWRVAAKLSDTSSPQNFKPVSVDLWNLSRVGNVINLRNPFTGASASISVNYANGSVVRFTKIGDYDNKRLTDTVEIKLSGDSFTGFNRLSLETLSDGKAVRTQTAVYTLKGERISGMSINGKNN